ncbi:aspartyl-tRNA synthetase [Bacillus sp. 1NLA3E]|nr:aspartyl-tRNA synthetase [Bacillus sp. 1NLA3E]
MEGKGLGNLSKAKYSIIFFGIILLIWGVFTFFSEKSASFSKPSEALYSIDENLLLIPAYKVKSESLYFFIKDKNKLGATFVNEGFFGWKAGDLLYSNIGKMKDYEKLNKYQVHDDYLIYGLIRNANHYQIKVNGHEAKIINLAMVDASKVKEYGLEGMSLWYYKSKIPLADGEIQLFSQDTKKLIDTEKLILEKDTN